jgi:hypothetical protein
MTTATSLDSILVQLEQVRARRPELRFGQLIAIVGSLAEDETGHSLWDVDDADFAVALDRFMRDLTGAGQSADSHDPAGDHQA